MEGWEPAETMTHGGDMLRMTRPVARQSAVPVEHTRPQRLPTNAEDCGELGVRRLRRIAIHRRQIRPQQHVANRGAAWEFLRRVRAGADVHGRRHNEPRALERSLQLCRTIGQRDRNARQIDDLAERAPTGDTHRLEQTTRGIRGKCQNHAVRVVRRASRDRHVPAPAFANEAGHALRDAQGTGEPLGQRGDELAHPVCKAVKSRFDVRTRRIDAEQLSGAALLDRLERLSRP